MSLAVVFDQPGDASVLQARDIPDRNPTENEVLIRHTAIEVNYIDVYHRKGFYQLSSNPKVPGVSAIGKIVALGEKVEGFMVGQKVGYATAHMGGAYSRQRCIDSSFVFDVPIDIDDRVAASCLVKGMTAHYLSHRVYIVRPGHGVLIHAAAGGVGQLLAQWCNAMGAYVIGTVGSEEKLQIARDNGCHIAINYNKPDWVAQVKAATKGFGVNAVYDSIGQATFDGSLECLMPMGIMVSYGASSGAVQNIDLSKIGAKSLFLTRPSLFDYKSDRMELVLSAQEIFTNVFDQTLKPTIFAEFPLSQAAMAHELLESRKATGSIILIP